MASAFQRRLTLAIALAAASPVCVIAAPPIPGAQSFGTSRIPPAGSVVIEKNSVALAPVTADELLAGAKPNLGSREGNAVSSGLGLTVVGGLQPPPLAKSIRRELTGLWSYAPRMSSSGIESTPQVRVEVRSMQGAAGALTLRERPWISIPVELSTSQQLHRSVQGERWYEGNVVIEIPVATLVAAGTYTGRIEISQESP